jgi:hypothetical protein
MVRSHSGETTPGASFVLAWIAMRSEGEEVACATTMSTYNHHAEQAVVKRNGAKQVIDARIVGVSATRIEQVVLIERSDAPVFVAWAARR